MAKKSEGGFLDSFYNGVPNNTDRKAGGMIETPRTKTKCVTYSLKEDNIKYVDLRSTHFDSKSAFINYLIEKDMSDHPEIVELTKTLTELNNKS